MPRLPLTRRPKLTLSLKALRIVGFCEGMSFLLLLGIAMPLKYGFNEPLGVKILGSLHGGLWILYLGTAVWALGTLPGAIGKIALAFVASILPLGPFIFDSWVIRKQQELQQPGELPKS